jgi:hypothetical protein
VRSILVLGPNGQIDVKRRLIGKHELAIDDFHARTERRAARRVVDREKQLTAGLEDVLKRIPRFGQSPCRSPTRTTMTRPASLASSTHAGKSSVTIGSIEAKEYVRGQSGTALVPSSASGATSAETSAQIS